VHIDGVNRPVTEEDFVRWLLSQVAPMSQYHYWLRDILFRACWSPARSSDSTRVLECGNYNDFRESALVIVYEWLHAIDVYYQLSLNATNKVSSSNSFRCKVMRGSIPQMIPTEIDGELQVMWMIVIGVWVRKLKYGRWNHLWIFSCVSLLFFSSVDLGLVHLASAQDFPTC